MRDCFIWEYHFGTCRFFSTMMTTMTRIVTIRALISFCLLISLLHVMQIPLPCCLRSISFLLSLLRSPSHRAIPLVQWPVSRSRLPPFDADLSVSVSLVPSSWPWLYPQASCPCSVASSMSREVKVAVTEVTTNSWNGMLASTRVCILSRHGHRARLFCSVSSYVFSALSRRPSRRRHAGLIFPLSTMFAA